MKRLWFVVVCVALVCLASPAYAAAPGVIGQLPEGTLLPMATFPGEEITVQVGETCYGAAAWAGFTQGIVKNAPNFTFFSYKVEGPIGSPLLDTLVDVSLEESPGCWTRELWDPSSCELIGELLPFNQHLGVKPYMMAWFTPTFVPTLAGTYQVHATLLQTRPAPDLMLVQYEDENGELVTLKRPIVWMPAFIEVDWEFTVVE
jgi:hypothetical protein